MFENFPGCPASTGGDIDIIKTEFKILPDLCAEPWVLVFYFDKTPKHSLCDYITYSFPRAPTLRQIESSRENALSWANSEFVVDPFDAYKTGELPPKKPVPDIPQYMFEHRPITLNTWFELTVARLDTYSLSDGTALLVDPETREYCYVFWDEAEQCSNPYPSHDEAVKARQKYIDHL